VKFKLKGDLFMSKKKWLPIDVLFLISGFPSTCELKQDIVKRLKKMGYEVKHPELLDRHEEILDRDYIKFYGIKKHWPPRAGISIKTKKGLSRIEI
jgi:hypothetical protein